MKLKEIMLAGSFAKSTASMIRSGTHVPALRHWAALAALGETYQREQTPQPSSR